MTLKLFFLGTNLIVSCLYFQLQKLWLRTYQVSSGWRAAVCAGVCYHQADKCFPSWRSETKFIFTDSRKPPPQWTHLQRQQVEYSEELHKVVAPDQRQKQNNILSTDFYWHSINNKKVKNSFIVLATISISNNNIILVVNGLMCLMAVFYNSKLL